MEIQLGGDRPRIQRWGTVRRPCSVLIQAAAPGVAKFIVIDPCVTAWREGPSGSIKFSLFDKDGTLLEESPWAPLSDSPLPYVWVFTRPADTAFSGYVEVEGNNNDCYWCDACSTGRTMP